MPLKLFARARRFCSTRIFAGREDRSFYLPSLHLLLFLVDVLLLFLFVLLLHFVCIARTGEPVGIRTGSTDLGPLLLFFSSRKAASGESPASRDCSGLRPLLLFLSSSFPRVPLFPVCSPFAVFCSSFPSVVPLCFLSRLFSSSISVRLYVSCSSNYFYVLLSSTCGVYNGYIYVI